MIKNMLMAFCAITFICTTPAQAEEKTKKPAPAAVPAKAEMQPDLRKILEEQAKAESAAWKTSNIQYAQKCLSKIDPGKQVPPEMAVESTNCYIEAINKHVKPVALNTHMVDDMTKEWSSLARKYGAKQITHKEWLAGMQATQKKFAEARIQIIKGLIDEAQKKAAAPAKDEAKTVEKKK